MAHYFILNQRLSMKRCMCNFLSFLYQILPFPTQTTKCPEKQILFVIECTVYELSIKVPVYKSVREVLAYLYIIGVKLICMCGSQFCTGGSMCGMDGVRVGCLCDN